ncbi:MAG TPA: dihydrofolate reductase family protein [Ktedonobacterales bacterium]|nr:dihydrofolate reductase family protein [Ktedonobacterales bacterium]
MRKIIVTEFLTLDGVMEAPNEWSFPYWNDEIGTFKLDELFASDALLLGRVTYDGFAAAWPSQSDEAGFADRMNGVAKYVVSTTLKDATWNNSTIIAENVAEEVGKLKQQPGQDILIAGSANLIGTLMRDNLIDEFQMLVYPVVLGKGKRLFPDGIDATLKLIESKPYDSGVVLLRYHVLPKDAAK